VSELRDADQVHDVDSGVAPVRRGVDAVLAEHLAALGQELTPLGPACDDLVDVLRGTLSGGKRFRAALCYWSWRAHGGGSGDEVGDEQLFRVGAALELFHAAALLHDDVMDASDTRRGRPAAHRVFEHRHAERAWTGNGARFGESAAILLGDLALVASERELSHAVAELATAVRRPARAIFDTMRTEVTAGQYLDVLSQHEPWESDPEAAEHRTRAVVRAKSARYSVEHPLTLGAVLAGADEQAVALCRDVGLPLGEAFQLRDDLLGVFGDPARTGKPAGDDLREGKRTVLVVRALAAASAEQLAILRAGLGRPDLTRSEVETLRAVIRSTGAPAAVERLIDDLAGPALARLGDARLAEPGRSVLMALGRAVVEREA
jgi:geranylgeranyl diphosphate synthase type I